MANSAPLEQKYGFCPCSSGQISGCGDLPRDPTWNKLRITFKEGATLAKPNYQFQKRQRELEKKKKKEEKRQRKQAKSDGEESQDQNETVQKDS